MQFDDLEATVSHTCRGVRGVPNGSNATIVDAGEFLDRGFSQSQFSKSPNAPNATAADCANLMEAAYLMVELPGQIRSGFRRA